MDDLYQCGLNIFNQQPFSQLVGAQLSAIAPGQVGMTLAIREDLKQHHGFVHGGALSYLADTALTFAGGTVLGDVVTAEYKINYLRPAIGQQLRVNARVLACGKTQAVCQCDILAIHDGEERLVAVATGTIVKAKPA